MENFINFLKNNKVTVTDKEWDHLERKLEKSHQTGRRSSTLVKQFPYLGKVAAVALLILASGVGLLWFYEGEGDAFTSASPSEEVLVASYQDDVSKLSHRIFKEEFTAEDRTRTAATISESNIQAYLANHPNGQNWMVHLKLIRDREICQASITSINDKPLDLILNPQDTNCTQFKEEPTSTQLQLVGEGENEKIYLVLQEPIHSQDNEETISLELQRIY